MDLQECIDLVWKDILQEDRKNFTPEFRENVIETIKKIRALPHF